MTLNRNNFNEHKRNELDNVKFFISIIERVGYNFNKHRIIVNFE